MTVSNRKAGLLPTTQPLLIASTNNCKIEKGDSGQVDVDGNKMN